MSWRAEASAGSWADNRRVVTARSMTAEQTAEWRERQAAEAEQNAAAATGEEREMWERRAAQMRVEAVR